MTVEEKRRELFEVNVLIPSGVVWDKGLQLYVGENFWLVDYAWTAFNAALDAIEIELPEAPDLRSGGGDVHWGITTGIDGCKRSIESLNLGIKIK